MWNTVSEMCSPTVSNWASRRGVGNDRRCSRLLFTVPVMSLTDRDRVLFTTVCGRGNLKGKISMSKHIWRQQRCPPVATAVTLLCIDKNGWRTTSTAHVWHHMGSRFKTWFYSRIWLQCRCTDSLTTPRSHVSAANLFSLFFFADYKRCARLLTRLAMSPLCMQS